MSLEIRTTPAILEINRTPGKQSIEQANVNVNGSISFAKVRVEGTVSKVSIDQNQCFNESGLKDNKTFSNDSANYAKQKMQESIRKIVEQGNRLKDIHLGGSAIADNARYNSVDQFTHEFGMVSMPNSRPRIDVTEGQLDINVEKGQITGKIISNKPNINYQVGKVETSLKQYNSISIKYLDERLNLQV